MRRRQRLLGSCSCFGRRKKRLHGCLCIHLCCLLLHHLCWFFLHHPCWLFLHNHIIIVGNHHGEAWAAGCLPWDRLALGGLSRHHDRQARTPPGFLRGDLRRSREHHRQAWTTRCAFFAFLVSTFASLFLFLVFRSFFASRRSFLLLLLFALVGNLLSLLGFVLFSVFVALLVFIFAHRLRAWLMTFNGFRRPNLDTDIDIILVQHWPCFDDQVDQIALLNRCGNQRERHALPGCLSSQLLDWKLFQKVPLLLLLPHDNIELHDVWRKLHL
mmetsp:Transcript_7818/g.18012  ORF Transcript_7818/g.18012 Transcript_7818/m.18012 type:complete len:271 (-) Transcript_7818:11-823(-)